MITSSDLPCVKNREAFFPPPPQLLQKKKKAKVRKLCHSCPVIDACRLKARGGREEHFQGGEDVADRWEVGYGPKRWTHNGEVQNRRNKIGHRPQIPVDWELVNWWRSHTVFELHALWGMSSPVNIRLPVHVESAVVVDISDLRRERAYQHVA